MTSNSNRLEGGKNEEKLERLRAQAEIENNRQDNTSRKNIAYWFTVSFVVIIAIIVVGAPIYNTTIGQDSPLDIVSLLESFCSHFGAPLGFVLGYYFKDKNAG